MQCSTTNNIAVGWHAEFQYSRISEFMLISKHPISNIKKKVSRYVVLQCGIVFCYAVVRSYSFNLSIFIKKVRKMLKFRMPPIFRKDVTWRRKKGVFKSPVLKLSITILLAVIVTEFCTKVGSLDAWCLTIPSKLNAWVKIQIRGVIHPRI